MRTCPTVTVICLQLVTEGGAIDAQKQRGAQEHGDAIRADFRHEAALAVEQAGKIASVCLASCPTVLVPVPPAWLRCRASPAACGRCGGQSRWTRSPKRFRNAILPFLPRSRFRPTSSDSRLPRYADAARARAPRFPI